MTTLDDQPEHDHRSLMEGSREARERSDEAIVLSRRLMEMCAEEKREHSKSDD